MKGFEKMSNQAIDFLYLSQEELIDSGAFNIKMTITALQNGLQRFKEKRILFPEKIVQIFDEETQERINCLPATLLDEKVCGVKWVSVFPNNPQIYGKQNLSAIIVLSSIVNGFPVCVMDGTLCSNLRVAAMGATAADYLAKKDAKSIGFIGAGEQAKMHLLGMVSVRPGLEVCKVAAKHVKEEQDFINSLKGIVPNIKFIPCNTVLGDAIKDSDIIVTATSAQAPLLKADWIKKGAFYSHIGGWEDEFKVVQLADKIVCDDWETVKHRTQTVSRCYKEGIITDDDIYANIIDILDGTKPGRDNDEEFIYFNAVGLAYADIAIAHAMYSHAKDNGFGKKLEMQKNMIFEKEGLTGKITI